MTIADPEPQAEPWIPTGVAGPMAWDPQNRVWVNVGPGATSPARAFWAQLIGTAAGQVCPPGVWTRITWQGDTAGTDFPAPAPFDRIDLTLEGNPVDGFYLAQWALLVTGPTNVASAPIGEGDIMLANPGAEPLATGSIQSSISQHYTPATVAAHATIGLAINPDTTAATIVGNAGVNFQLLCMGSTV